MFQDHHWRSLRGWETGGLGNEPPKQTTPQLLLLPIMRVSPRLLVVTFLLMFCPFQALLWYLLTAGDPGSAPVSRLRITSGPLVLYSDQDIRDSVHQGLASGLWIQKPSGGYAAGILERDQTVVLVDQGVAMITVRSPEDPDIVWRTSVDIVIRGWGFCQ